MHPDDNFTLTPPPEPVKADPCWTCGEPNRPQANGQGHNCIASLKHHIRRLEQEYGELKEKALDAGITVRTFHL